MQSLKGRWMVVSSADPLSRPIRVRVRVRVRVRSLCQGRDPLEDSFIRELL